MVTTDTIAAMKTLASDPKKRAVLAKDSTCIGGLVIVLSNADPVIVKEALQTLLLLCECHEARTLLQKHVGMVDQLETILMSCSNKKDDEVTHLAEELFTKLSEVTGPAQTPIKDTNNVSRNSKNHSLLGQPKARSIILQLRGFQDKSDRDLCARLLLKTKGVISITFDLNKKRCILRTKMDVKPEILVASIAKSMTMTAQQVVKNEHGEESFITFNTSQHILGQEKENDDLPDYLSDDSETTFVEDKAVKRPTEEDKKKSAGWFSAAANFLTNSFYWVHRYL